MADQELGNWTKKDPDIPPRTTPNTRNKPGNDFCQGGWRLGLNVLYALKTRYTRYTVDGQRFKVLHFRHTGCYTLLHYRWADYGLGTRDYGPRDYGPRDHGTTGRVSEFRNQLIFSG